MNRAHRAALEAADDGAIAHSAVDGWCVRSPRWWDGFRSRSLDAILSAGLVRIIPSRQNYRTVKITAAGARALCAHCRDRKRNMTLVSSR